MQTYSDITLTLLGDDFDAYRITVQTDLGASFVAAHLPDIDITRQTLLAAQVRPIQAKAKDCQIAVRVE